MDEIEKLRWQVRYLWAAVIGCGLVSIIALAKTPGAEPPELILAERLQAQSVSIVDSDGNVRAELTIGGGDAQQTGPGFYLKDVTGTVRGAFFIDSFDRTSLELKDAQGALPIHQSVAKNGESFARFESLNAVELNVLDRIQVPDGDVDLE